MAHSKIRKNLLDDFDRTPIEVYLCVKPLNEQEIKAGESKDCLEIEDIQTVASHPPKTSFRFKYQSRNPAIAETMERFGFSRVFGPEINQKEVFEETTLDVVKDFINV